MKKTLSILAMLLVWAVVNVHAMTGVEFLSLGTASERKHLLEPITISFVSQGYKNVPDWVMLSITMENLIRKNGYANKDIEEIALEAAIAGGMTK